MINGHGDDLHNHPGREMVSNFSSNTHCGWNFSALRHHLCACLRSIHTYPEPDAASLARLLAGKHRVGRENICVTNGAVEAIYLIAQTFRRSRSRIIVPTFREYEDACAIHGHELSFADSPEEIAPGTEMVWICNPNNPDGRVYDIGYLQETVKKQSRTLFIFDQSYSHFTGKKSWNPEEAVQYRNVVLIHSMTKQFCIPGLRLGYLTAPAEIARKISGNQMPWSVNALAIEAGKFLTENRTDLPEIAGLLQETARLRKALGGIAGLSVYPTDTHFFLGRLNDRKAADLKQYLIDQHGILIRDAANFRGLDDGYFRIAAQSPAENDRLVKAIQAWI